MTLGYNAQSSSDCPVLLLVILPVGAQLLFNQTMLFDQFFFAVGLGCLRQEQVLFYYSEA